jgi:hypothetical protein
MVGGFPVILQVYRKRKAYHMWGSPGRVMVLCFLDSSQDSLGHPKWRQNEGNIQQKSLESCPGLALGLLWEVLWQFVQRLDFGSNVGRAKGRQKDRPSLAEGIEIS